MTLAASHDKYVPKHRQDPARRASRAAVRTMFLLSSAAVLGTGAAVGGGMFSLGLVGSGLSADAGTNALSAAAQITDPSHGAQAVADPASATDFDEVGAGPAQAATASARQNAPVTAARRSAPVSRSDRRGVADVRKQAALALEPGSNAMTRTEDASDDDPRGIAETLVGDSTQFGCLDSLWAKESGWRIDADNPSSSAYGIPQALPGSKMSAFGADWATNPVTQIRWGLDYIEDRYGSPCGAWSHSQGYGWY